MHQIDVISPAERIPCPPTVGNLIMVGGALCPQRDRSSRALPSDWSNIHTYNGYTTTNTPITTIHTWLLLENI